MSLILLSIITQIAQADMHSVSLSNAAAPNLKMPVVGLGTYSYTHGGNPENWTNAVGYNASLLWASVGGRRFDSAYEYRSKQGVADAILSITQNFTKIPRSDIFITQKVHLGYEDVMNEYEQLLQMFQTDYFDLVLIHWPSDPNSWNTYIDPVCQTNNTNTYNVSLCRQHTWRALEDMFKNGTAKAIGVSNFEEKHMTDIINMNSLLPAVNQFEFHGYWHEYDLVEYCQS
eukprot:433759_1